MDNTFKDETVEEFANFVRSKGGKLLGVTTYAKGEYVFDIRVPIDSPVECWGEAAFNEFMAQKGKQHDNTISSSR